MQWVQDANQSNVCNINNIRHFRNKKKEYLKAKIDDLDTKGKMNISETFMGTSTILRILPA